MNKSVPGNYVNYFVILLLSAVTLASPRALYCQGYLKAELVNTNCPLANHEADRWFFGQNAGLDFRSQNPVTDLSNYIMNVYTSPAIIADSTGNILFYSDGIRVYDRLGQIMPNGNGLHGFASYAMPVIIIPKPGSDTIYYIFTTYRARQSQGDLSQILYGLEYNEVNMNRNGGLGDITKKNKVLLPPEVSSKLSAVKKSNGVDYWVVGHNFNSNEFCAFSVTSNGVDTANYQISGVGIVQSAVDTNVSNGYMKISPDGTKLAQAIYGLDVYEIFDFDASNGKVANGVTSPAIFNEAYGIEFSSDSRYLYGTTTSTDLPQPNYTPPSYLFQFDVNSGGSIFNPGSYDTVTVDTNGSYFGGMQLGTDGRIYVSRAPFGNAALSVIENPKRPGAACNFTTNAMDLLGEKSHFGFPNFVQSYFDRPHFDVENVCFEDSTIFTLQNNSNIDFITWQFGDAGNPGSSTDLQPTHSFSAPGSYQVQVTEYFNGVPYGPYTETVNVNELPNVDIGDTVYMYPGSPILLDAGSGYVSYEWSTGENTQIVQINDKGTYYVTVQNDRCCFKTDTAQVIFFDVMVPNAFRPGGANNIFKAYASSPEAINNFVMYIYNRWGQQMYVSKDMNQGWDGKINGVDAPGDVYVWLINYDVQRSGKTVTIAYKGNVLLLR